MAITEQMLAGEVFSRPLSLVPYEGVTFHQPEEYSRGYELSAFFADNYFRIHGLNIFSHNPFDIQMEPIGSCFDQAMVEYMPTTSNQIVLMEYHQLPPVEPHCDQIMVKRYTMAGHL